MKIIRRGWTVEESTPDNFYRLMLLEVIPDTLHALKSEPEHGLVAHGLSMDDFNGVSCEWKSVLLPTIPIWQYVLSFHFSNKSRFRRLVQIQSEINPGTGLSYDETFPRKQKEVEVSV